MQSRIGRIGRLLAVALLLLPLAQLAQAAESRADVGVFGPNGRLTLDASKFVDKFPNGLAVTEIRVEIVDGLYYVSRKGYNLVSGACRRELAQLTNAYSQPLVAGAVAAGQHAWVFDGIEVRLLGCE